MTTVKSPSSNADGTPAARTSTPAICTSVSSRYDDVVGVVGGGEPGEVHPGPPDGEEHHAGSRPSGRDVALGDAVVQLDRGARRPRPRSRGRRAAPAASTPGAPPRGRGPRAGAAGAPDGSGHAAQSVPFRAAVEPLSPGDAAGRSAGVAAQPQQPPRSSRPRRPGRPRPAPRPGRPQGDRGQQLDRVGVALRALGGQADSGHRPGHLEGARTVAAPVLVARHAPTLRPVRGNRVRVKQCLKTRRLRGGTA